MERFYSIEHLSTEELRELFSEYRSRGWLDYDYYRLMPEGITPPELSDEEILFNMDASNPHNYFVYMIDHEDEQDGIMIALGLTDHPTFGAYLHLDKKLLDEIVGKYGLKESKRSRERPFLFNSGNGLLN